MKMILLSEQECKVLFNYLYAVENCIEEGAWEVEEPKDPDYELINNCFATDRKVIQNIRRRLARYEVIPSDYTV